jgi:hypothetical protein
MLSFLAKKDKNKPSTYKPKVPPKYWTFFANHITRMTEIIIMSLFTNSSRQLRRITEQCWKCPRTAPSSTCHFFKKKKQNISWSIWESTQAFLHFERNTQLVVFILKDEQLWFIQDKSTFHKENFHIDKEYISVNTKSKNTEKQQCVHLGVRDSASTNLLFLEKC